ncbi:hypothetical protein AB835_08655 [Candidatus Endobugula sertula]|uniref:NAD-dependent epimerase/dehydratase domain-containing protein n=1 Tax=Candidatus Endobugula sertula TaxID=62101 RepID=A0A1D2QPL1_9GAMM|nr:hypothetical protein AB835_08655 [Candidatus Endobugula sertula]
MKTWLVTGSAGFIGSNLCHYILQSGDSVIGYDNFATGKQENVDRVMQSSDGRYRFIQGDICDSDAIDRVAEEADIIVHLAAQGSVQKSFTDVHYNNKQNIDGFLTVMLAACTNKVANFIYASSCAVYGETDQLLISEHVCPRPVSPYASSKVMNDYLADNLRSRYPDTYMTGLRFFNVFGPWQDPNGDYAAVVPKWIDACMVGHQPILFGDGSATRDFCYVGNICELIVSIVSQKNHIDGIFNIGCGVSISLGELYKTIANALIQRGHTLHFDGPDFRPWRDGDIVHSLGDITLAKEQLNYSPKINLELGINEILKQQYAL